MFLQMPPESAETAHLEQIDIDRDGYVMNLTHAWAWRPEVAEAFLKLRGLLTDASALSPRELALIVSATASTLGDSYCSLAWGEKLARASDAASAAAVLSGGEPEGLTPREAALLHWVRTLVRDPNATTAQNVESLRAAGFSEREIFEATAFAAFRLAFATVNDALGARPDRRIAAAAPAEVRDAVTYGRAPDDGA